MSKNIHSGQWGLFNWQQQQQQQTPQPIQPQWSQNGLGQPQQQQNQLFQNILNPFQQFTLFVSPQFKTRGDSGLEISPSAKFDAKAIN